MRSLCIASALVLLLGSARSASAEPVPPGTDLSAYRVDCDVLGWSKDYTQVAAACLEVKRGPLGRHRGGAMLVIFGTGSTKPLQNVELHFITQADMPHDPLPLPEAKEMLNFVDYAYRRLWPKRPIKKRPSSAARVELLWDPVVREPGICSPAVALRMRWRGELRFQPHELLGDVKASCSALRLTEVKTYWAKGDLAVTMPRFDYSPTRNESSFRYPVSAQWGRARALRIGLHAGAVEPRLATTRAALEAYGKVRLEREAQTPSDSSVAVAADLKLLGERLARELGVPRSSSPPPDGMDVLVILGAVEP